MEREIRFVLDFRAEPEAVWKALTDPGEIPRWHNYVSVDLDRLEPGGRFTFHCGDDPDDHGVIVALEESRKLSYKWTSSEPEPTQVEYELAPTERGTRVHFRNGPFPEGEDWDRLYEADYRGWVDITLKLKRLVEEGG